MFYTIVGEIINFSNTIDFYHTELTSFVAFYYQFDAMSGFLNGNNIGY